MKKYFILPIFLVIVSSGLVTATPIKIMPVGNSITAGEHYGFPAVEERTGYRKDLYWMLTNAGYNVDFVGSQNHGERSKDDPDWYDWNSEAYPGWRIEQITGQLESEWVVYKPDIVLIHVGTNGPSWDVKPGQVMDMLDFLNSVSVEYNHKMTVFLCAIIDRFEGGHDQTTQFNQAVADLLAARTDDQFKIIWVDMENGADFDYSDAPPDPNANPPYEGGDMWGTTYPGVKKDEFHPNDKGNTKMAVKFFNELVKELGPPNTLLADYQFEGDASDATGNFNGTLEGDASIVYDTKRGNVLSLKETGYVSIPPALADSLNDFTFSAWVNFAGTNPWAGLMGIGMSAGSTHPYWDFHLKSDKTIRFYSSVDVTWPPDGCAQTVINYTLPTEWTHVVFTFKKDSGAVVYINGEAQELKAWAGDNDYSVSPGAIGADVFNIGKDSFNQTTLTNTLIDNFKFYKTVLNDLAIASIYNAEKIQTNPTKIAHWNCDGDVTDKFGLSNGILHNIEDSLFVDGYIQQGKAIDFNNGSDSSYVEVPDNTLIDFDSTTSFTASALVKVIDFSADMNVIFKGAIDSDGDRKKGKWWCMGFKNNTLRMYIDDDVNKTQLEYFNPSEKMHTRLDWNHLVAVRDLEQDSVRLFINGEQVASMEDVTEGDIRTTHLPLIIGNNQDHNKSFKGAIDDVQLYNYALSADEVKVLFDSYRIRILDTAVDNPVNIPLTYELKQNYPNPFNPTTQIEFQLKQAGQTKITVYNTMGQLVSTILDKRIEMGAHSVTVQLDRFSSGVYFYHIQSGKFSETKKMLFMK